MHRGEKSFDGFFTNAAAIDVEVRDGVVTLKGQASGSSARREAEEVAKHAKGVIEVYNELRVE